MLAKLTPARSARTWLAAAAFLAAASEADAQTALNVGSQAGSQVFFNSTLPRYFNFGVTNSGGSANLSISQVNLTLKKDATVTNDVVVKIYGGFGGTGPLLGTYTLAASLFNNQFTTQSVTFGTPLALSSGAYSISLTTVDTNQYFFKPSQLTLTNTSNGSLVTGSFWVPDSRTDGTATTTLNAATPVLAEHTLGSSSVNFGNFRLGATLSQAVSLTNSAFYTSNNYTEALAISSTSATGATISTGGLTFLDQGLSSNLTVGMSSATAGVRSGSITVNFDSVKGNSASTTTGPTAVGNKVIAVSGTGYRAAVASFSTTNVSLGNHRITETNVTGTTTVTNNVTNDGYSEKLKLTDGGKTGSATLGALPASLTAAGNSVLTVGLSSITAGANSAAVTLGLTSDGTGTSGLTDLSLGSQAVTVTATGYRAAAASFSTTAVDLGNHRITETGLTGTTTVSNTSTNDAYSEKLKLTSSGTTGSATVGSMPALIAAGSNANVTVGLSSITAGSNSGTVTLGKTSDGTGTSGLADLSLGSQAVTVTATGYRAAAASFSATAVDLGKFHVGATSLSGSTTISNSVTNDAYSEKLKVVSATPSGATVGSLPALIAAGGNSALTVGIASVSAAGANTGSITLGLESDGTGTSGLSALSLGSQVINVSATGYTGQSTWNVDANGVWNSFDGWDLVGGKPGVDGSLSTGDTAIFGSAATSARTITLGSAVPTLRSLTFDNASAAYYLVAGGVGRIQLGTSAGDGTLNVNAGNHTVSVGVELAQATTASVASASRLLLSGGLNGTGALTKTGSGTLALDGTGDLSGTTTVSSGLLTVNGSIASSDVTVTSGGTLGGSGTVGGTTIESGGTLAPGNSPGNLTTTGDLTWLSGGNYNWQLLDAIGTAGSGWDLVTATGNLDLSALSSANRFNINLWTLASIHPDVNGLALNFDNTQSYTWTIARVGGSIIGFSANYFNLNLNSTNGTGGFANPLGNGTISIVQNGKDLNLVFTQAVPEPSTYGLMLGGAALALVALRRRRRS